MNSYVLYVDSSRIAKANLIALARAGVQIVVMSATAYHSKADLLEVAELNPSLVTVAP